jgi:hypothetical protein
MNNPHLALIFIRRFSDFFREPLDQLSIFFRGATRPVRIPEGLRARAAL